MKKCTKFVKNNPHPKNKKHSDCVIRSICLATNENYEDVFNELMDLSKEKLVPYFEEEVYKIYLEKRGFKRKSHTVKKGETRPKVLDFGEGTNILRVSNHLTTTIDGVLYDVWNCMQKAVYVSWYI